MIEGETWNLKAKSLREMYPQPQPKSITSPKVLRAVTTTPCCRSDNSTAYLELQIMDELLISISQVEIHQIYLSIVLSTLYINSTAGGW